MNDEVYMKRALRLARRGEGRTSPNPMVGAVIVRDGEIISEGYHRHFGGDHAEIDAIKRATESVKGSTMYVTLEPCSHYGKTPPCVDRLIAEKFRRVVVGSPDPNPLVAGRGIEKLRQSSIETAVGVLEAECRMLNEKFFTFMQSGIPFVTVKYAQTIDGRIAAASGHSQWISSTPSRTYAHLLRSRHDAIMVGIGTVLTDDPELTVRLVRGRSPRRVILDPTLKIPLQSRILENQNVAETIIVTTSGYDAAVMAELKERNIETIVLEALPRNRLDIRAVMRALGQKGISSVLVEGGSKIITACIQERCVDRFVIITAPKILGKGIEAVGELGSERIENALQLDIRRVFRKGGDIIVDARIKK